MEESCAKPENETGKNIFPAMSPIKSTFYCL